MLHKLPNYLLLAFTLLASPSWALDIGDKAPEFTLTSSTGEKVSLKDYADKVVVLEWYNKGCPYVDKHYKNGDMQALQEKYGKQNVVWLNINSTRDDHSDYLGSEGTNKTVENQKIKAKAMLLDAEGTVGKLYKAKTTPHMYVINKGLLDYQGAIDDEGDAYADPKEAKNYVALALDSILAGKEVATKETRPYGCSVKYAN